jgi:DnaK suppressor protein
MRATTTTDRTEHLRAHLEAELTRTIARLRALGAQVSPEIAGVAGDSPYDTFENAEAHAARETLFASRERLALRAEQLAAALGRLEAGAYGTCGECGEPIAIARLRAIPEARTCVTCQERLDRQGVRYAVARRAFEGDLDELPLASPLHLDRRGEPRVETGVVDAVPGEPGMSGDRPRSAGRPGRPAKPARPRSSARRHAA